MTQAPLRRIAAALLLASGLSAQATVINFDSNVYQPPEWGGLGWTYFYSDGFYWGNPGWAIVSDGYMAQFGNSFGSPSGDNAVFNGDLQGTQQTLTVQSQFGEFDFNGAKVAGWGKNDQAQGFTATQVTVQGYRNADLVGTVTLDLSADHYQWLAANFQGVTEVRFTANAPGKYWLLDDLSFNEAIVVPEPDSLALAGLGLLVLCGAAAKGRRSGAGMSAR